MKQKDVSQTPKEILETYLADRSRASSISQKTETRLRRTLLKRRGLAKDFVRVITESGLPWLKLALRFPYQQMLEEAVAMKDRFVDHRSDPEGKGYVAKGWKALCLHAISETKSMSRNVYGYKREADVPYKWTTLAHNCPATYKFFKETFPHGPYYRVRVMMIEPGGYILPHTDRIKSFLWEINMALNNPERCFFKMKGQGYVPFKPGEAYILDVSNEHAVVNYSDEPRYHIIVHGAHENEPSYMKMILKSYKSFLSQKEDSRSGSGRGTAKKL